MLCYYATILTAVDRMTVSHPEVPWQPLFTNILIRSILTSKGCPATKGKPGQFLSSVPHWLPTKLFLTTTFVPYSSNRGLKWKAISFPLLRFTVNLLLKTRVKIRRNITYQVDLKQWRIHAKPLDRRCCWTTTSRRIRKQPEDRLLYMECTGLSRIKYV